MSEGRSPDRVALLRQGVGARRWWKAPAPSGRVTAMSNLGDPPPPVDPREPVAHQAPACVNLDRVRAQVTDPETLRTLAPLRSVGLSVRGSGGDSEIRVTLVAR